MITCNVIELGNGWYSFKNVSQEKSYIKIDTLNCGTNRKALNRAVKILKRQGLLDYDISILEKNA